MIQGFWVGGFRVQRYRVQGYMVQDPGTGVPDFSVCLLQDMLRSEVESQSQGFSLWFKVVIVIGV